MAWFRRLRRKLRNYTSDGDYAGSHGGGSASASGSTTSRSTAEFGIHADRMRDTLGPK